MGIADKITIAMVPIGVGLACIGWGGPQMWNHIPTWALRWLVYVGIGLIVGGVMLFILLHFPLKRPEKASSATFSALDEIHGNSNPPNEQIVRENITNEYPRSPSPSPPTILAEDEGELKMITTLIAPSPSTLLQIKGNSKLTTYDVFAGSMEEYSKALEALRRDRPD